MRASHVFLYFVFCFNVFSVIHQVSTNLYAGRNSSTFMKRFKLSSFLVHISYMTVLVAIYLAYTQLTGSRVLLECPKLTILGYGGEFLQATLRTMVSNVTHENFMPYRRSSFFNWTLLFLNGVFLYTTNFPLIDEFWMILAINGMAWGTVIHYVFYVL